MGTTLCVPTIFIAYTGEALDFKVPLLRSLEAVDKASVAVCQYFDAAVGKVHSYLGWEQEYFLVDEGLWAARPDLMLTGRTLIGHESAKNQQSADHYFGAIPTRVMAFMKELEYECWKLGIPVKTRHNEVAPNQFELAPVYEEANLANDHNLLLMSTIKRICRKHCFRALLHEKPFKGINGSGKHCNWSLGTDTGVNLLSPGKTPKDNLQFITFLVNVMMAVYKYNGLLKASIVNATNAHRLGANEAPPAIISVFLGRQLSEALDKMSSCTGQDEIVFNGKSGFKMEGFHIFLNCCWTIPTGNRTSPFAFTGNRFEFRAVGSSANCAGAMTVLNAAVADQLTEFKTAVDARIRNGEDSMKAIYTVLKGYVRMQSDSFRWKRVHRGVEGGGGSARTGLHGIRTGDVRPLPGFGKRGDVRADTCAEQKRAGGACGSHVGDLHQEDTDRSEGAGRYGDEPYPAGGFGLRKRVAG